MKEAIWFKLTRIRLDLNCEDMANRMHVTKQTISNIETGKTTTESSLYYYELVLEQIKRERENYEEIKI